MWEYDPLRRRVQLKVTTLNPTTAKKVACGGHCAQVGCGTDRVLEKWGGNTILPTSHKYPKMKKCIVCGTDMIAGGGHTCNTCAQEFAAMGAPVNQTQQFAEYNSLAATVTANATVGGARLPRDINMYGGNAGGNNTQLLVDPNDPDYILIDPAVEEEANLPMAFHPDQQPLAAGGGIPLGGLTLEQHLGLPTSSSGRGSFSMGNRNLQDIADAQAQTLANARRQLAIMRARNAGRRYQPGVDEIEWIPSDDDDELYD